MKHMMGMPPALLLATLQLFGPEGICPASDFRMRRGTAKKPRNKKRPKVDGGRLKRRAFC